MPLIMSMATAIVPTPYSTLSDKFPTWEFGARSVNPKVEEVAVEAVSVPKILQEIARCESGNRQFDENGNVIKGYVNSKDIGKYQINEYYWGAEAKELGYDIYTEEGNTLMALYIYNTKGTQPWLWSKKCWSQIN